RAGVFHHGQHAGCATARAVHVGLIGVAMTAMQRVEVTRLVGRMNGHAVKARLFEIVDTRRPKRGDPGGSHGGMLQSHTVSVSGILLMDHSALCPSLKRQRREAWSS